MSLQFKTARIRDEYTQLPQKNPPLFELVVDLAALVASQYGLDLTLTSILRTAEEQASLYAQSDSKMPNSAHLTWEAVDIRSLIFTRKEIDELIGYLNGKYKNANGKTVALYHTIPGNAPHFHIQLYRQ